MEKTEYGGDVLFEQCWLSSNRLASPLRDLELAMMDREMWGAVSQHFANGGAGIVVVLRDRIPGLQFTQYRLRIMVLAHKAATTALQLSIETDQQLANRSQGWVDGWDNLSTQRESTDGS